MDSIFDLLFHRVWWSMWRQQLGQVRVSRALHASAVKHRALSLQLQVSPVNVGFGILCPCCQVSHPQREVLGLPCSSGPEPAWGAEVIWKAGLFQREAAVRNKAEACPR